MRCRRCGPGVQVAKEEVYCTLSVGDGLALVIVLVRDSLAVVSCTVVRSSIWILPAS